MVGAPNKWLGYMRRGDAVQHGSLPMAWTARSFGISLAARRRVCWMVSGAAGMDAAFCRRRHLLVPSVPDQQSPFDQASLFDDDRAHAHAVERLGIRASTADASAAGGISSGNVHIDKTDADAGEYAVSSSVIG
jgi:hypothetical protein